MTSGERSQHPALAGFSVWEWDVDSDRLRFSVPLQEIAALAEPWDPKTAMEFAQGLDPVSAEQWRQAAHELFAESGARQHLTVRVNGTNSLLHLNASSWEQANGQVTCVRGVVASEATLKSFGSNLLQRRIKQMAATDSVTGLLNREALLTQVDRALAPPDADGVLLYLRVGEVELINETCSIDSGDEMLREVAAVLRDRVADSSIVGRTRAGHFCVFLSGVPAEGARLVAEEVVDALRDYQFTCNEKVFSLSCAVGVASASAGEAATDIFSRGRKACRAAVQGGRSQIYEYDPGHTEVLQRSGDLEWSARLHEALVEGHFVLYQQPIQPLTSGGQTRLVEILLRLEERGGEIVLPDQFIPVAERHGLMTTVDRWVVREALPLLSQVPDNIGFVLNLSGQSLAEDGFFSFVADQLHLTGVDPGRVVFEITETAAINDLDRALRFIAIYRALGCQFVLDDVGSGSNTLANLRRLPVDMMKIDGSFVRDMVEEEVERIIVRSFHQVARASGLISIAESVESREAMVQLAEIGVDYVQGFWVAEPERLEVNRLEEVLDRARERVLSVDVGGG